MRAGALRPRPHPRRLARRRDPLLALAVLLGLVVACTPERSGVWRRWDLVAATPQVELLNPASAAIGDAFEARSGWLGPRDLRGDAASKGRSPLPAGLIFTLRQRAGTRLVFRFELGATPLLSATPMADGEQPCPAGVRIAVRRPGGAASELLSTAVAEAAFAPPVQELDLGPWADGPVELLLEVEGDAGCVVEWGSPSLVSRVSRPVGRAGRRPNILLVGADTLRADHVGAWGREPSLTPTLDRLAAESDVFLDAFATFNATNPSFASILTGLYGKEHGVYDLLTPIAEETPTLQDGLDALGYDTLAILSAGHLAPRLARGFGRVSSAAAQVAAERSVDTAIDWLSEKRKAPFFLWLHLFDPHTPHTPPLPYAAGRRPAEPPGLGAVPSWTAFRPAGPRPYADPWLGGEPDLYAGEVAYLDRQLGRLLDVLASRGQLESTIVAVVGDHGENLEDHGVRYRHAGLWDTTLHVPLMIRWPQRAGVGRRIRGLVQTLDLFPTLLRAAAGQVPQQSGIDLLAVADGRERPRRMVFAEHADGSGAMLRTDRYKYIELAGNTFVAAGTSLYDLEADPGELDDLAGRGLAVEEELAALLSRWREWAAVRRGAAEEPDEEETRQLEALGYL